MENQPTHSSVPLTTGPPETVLDPPEPAVAAELAAALRADPGERKRLLAAVAAAHPSLLDAWAHLAEEADDPVESYAYARVGYHRGLDTLRASGWRGNGYVRWAYPTNRGFLRSLSGLRDAARQIGEEPEAVRCELFLHQLDPDWDRRSAEDER